MLTLRVHRSQGSVTLRPFSGQRKIKLDNLSHGTTGSVLSAGRGQSAAVAGGRSSAHYILPSSTTVLIKLYMLILILMKHTLIPVVEKN
jgi:hypothetical protein